MIFTDIPNSALRSDAPPLCRKTLREFGLDVAEGIGGDGVVGSLTRGAGNRSIALRADVDALRITERGSASYKSTGPGLMHACGHTSVLLGAARQSVDQGWLRRNRALCLSTC